MEKEKSSVKSRKFYFCGGHSTMKMKFDYENTKLFYEKEVLVSIWEFH